MIRNVIGCGHLLLTQNNARHQYEYSHNSDLLHNVLDSYDYYDDPGLFTSSDPVKATAIKSEIGVCNNYAYKPRIDTPSNDLSSYEIIQGKDCLNNQIRSACGECECYVSDTITVNGKSYGTDGSGFVPAELIDGVINYKCCTNDYAEFAVSTFTIWRDCEKWYSSDFLTYPNGTVGKLTIYYCPAKRCVQGSIYSFTSNYGIDKNGDYVNINIQIFLDGDGNFLCYEYDNKYYGSDGNELPSINPAFTCFCGGHFTMLNTGHWSGGEVDEEVVSLGYFPPSDGTCCRDYYEKDIATEDEERTGLQRIYRGSFLDFPEDETVLTTLCCGDKVAFLTNRKKKPYYFLGLD